MKRGAIKRKFPVQQFKERADSAAFWEAWVGAVLARNGLYTLHYPFTVAENWQEVAEHYLTWDLEVGPYHPVEDQLGYYRKVEVKSLNTEFYGPGDYPYPDLMVCSQKSWDRKWGETATDRTVRDFLFVSRATGAIVWLPVGSPVTLNVPSVDREREQYYNGVRSSPKYLKDLQAFVESFRDKKS